AASADARGAGPAAWVSARAMVADAICVRRTAYFVRRTKTNKDADMTMSEHTMKAFDADLQDLTRVVAEMGRLAERQIVNGREGRAKRARTLGRRVVADALKVDALQREIEEKAILTTARRQPMAVDLREIVGALRLSNDLERIGDLAKNIAKRVGALDGDF